MIEYSIIVPVYNVEKVLGRCIESILNQTVKDFELILIDDGSTDKSGMICDEYQKMDTRIKVVHKKNEGVSKARNVGLDIAEGEYIVFVDSDDYVEREYLEYFGDKDVDLVVTGLYLCGEDLSINKKFSIDNTYLSLKNEHSIIYVLKSWCALPSVAKRYKRKIVKENKICFPEECSYGEDAIFVAKYLNASDDVVLKDMIAYRYCMYERPTLSKVQERDKFKKHDYVQSAIYHIFEGNKKIEEFLLNKYWWIVEKEIEQVCNSHLQTREKKVELITSCLDTSLSKICLDSKITQHIGCIHKIMYKLKNKVLFNSWLIFRSKLDRS